MVINMLSPRFGVLPGEPSIGSISVWSGASDSVFADWRSQPRFPAFAKGKGMRKAVSWLRSNMARWLRRLPGAATA